MTDTDEPMPYLTMAMHRGHSLQRADGGSWGCSCGEFASPADTDGSQVFAVFIEHASQTERGVWDYEAQRWVTITELADALRRLPGPPDQP